MAWWIFQNVVITTALVAAVAMVCRAGRIGPVARHALWVLVLVKFVTPPLVVWPWAAPDPFGIAAFDARPAEYNIAAATELDAPAAERDDDAGEQGAAATPSPGKNFGASAWLWLLAVWAAGSVSLLGIESTRLARLTRQVRAATPADSGIVRRVAVLAAHLGMQPVPVVMVAGHATPVVWGFGRPRLLWPAGLSADSTEACIDGLLVHELAHVKRGDHLVGWIELAAGIVWWWNPLFWYVRSALREQAELACDAWVIAALPNGRRAYAESLLALSGAAIRGASSSLAVVGIRATSRRVLERRLVMIMKGRTPLRLPLAGLCALAVMAIATLPAWATSQQPPSPPPVPAAAPAQAATAQPTPLPPSAKAAPAPTRTDRQEPPPKPARAAVRTVVPPTPARRDMKIQLVRHTDLPPEGQELVAALGQEQEAIQKEADERVAARREATLKALQALQDQFARAGKLDEAVAIRDYLRAGGPGPATRVILRTPTKREP